MEVCDLDVWGLGSSGFGRSGFNPEHPNFLTFKHSSRKVNHIKNIRIDQGWLSKVRDQIWQDKTNVNIGASCSVTLTRQKTPQLCRSKHQKRRFGCLSVWNSKGRSCSYLESILIKEIVCSPIIHSFVETYIKVL